MSAFVLDMYVCQKLECYADDSYPNYLCDFHSLSFRTKFLYMYMASVLWLTTTRGVPVLLTTLYYPLFFLGVCAFSYLKVKGETLNELNLIINWHLISHEGQIRKSMWRP